MSIELPTHQFASKILENNTKLDVIYQQADNFCRTCKTPSPMICVEQCELWKVKNEYLKLSEFVSKKNHLFNLLNALKNDRRILILNSLIQRPQNKKDLQMKLKTKGYNHSCSTIEEYVKPLLQTGLVRKEDSYYTLTIYGKKTQKAIKKFGINDILPVRSRCYEEAVLGKLNKGSKTKDDLLMFLPKKSYTRIMKRLQDRGLISKIKRPKCVVYFKTKKSTRKRLSQTERRVLDAIPASGISPHKLSKDVGINLRRTYKYLQKLRDKNLVFRKRLALTYELTSDGQRIAKFLEDVSSLASSASKKSTLWCSNTLTA